MKNTILTIATLATLATGACAPRSNPPIMQGEDVGSYILRDSNARYNAIRAEQEIQQAIANKALVQIHYVGGR